MTFTALHRYHAWMNENLPYIRLAHLRIPYILLLLSLVIVIQLSSPIEMGDTDMWYHIADGNQILQNNKIPNTLYHTFHEKSDYVWHNHFWGFQIVTAFLYEHTGYQGLVVLRAILVSLLVSMIALFLFLDQRSKLFWLKACIFIALASLMLDRGAQLRPHLITYFMIITFLFVLQQKREYIFILPMLALFWLNMHSVTWVVGALICGAYFIEELLKPKDSRNRKYLAGILLCLPIVLATPEPINLILEPFRIESSTLSSFIIEMRPVNPSLYTSIVLSLDQLNLTTTFPFLLLVTLFSLVIALKNKVLRISHFIILIGSFVLLIKGMRFIWEWSLLNLPLIITAINSVDFKSSKYSNRLISYSLIATALIPVIIFIKDINFDRPYPFDSVKLPTGTTEFLKTTKAKGNLFATSNEGGFFHQQLYPNIKIHSDMKLPEITHLEGSKAHQSPIAFERLTEKYRIDFVFTKDQTTLKDKLSELGYQAVFMDNIGLLYAHEELQKDLIDKYEIKIDLFKEIKDIPVEEFTSEIDRLLGIEKNERLLAVIIMRHFHAKNYHLAMPYAQDLIEIAPNSPTGYYWLGNLNENLDNFNEALIYYNKALNYGDKETNFKINLHIATCYYLLEDFKSAFETFENTLNIYTKTAAPEDMFQYAFSSVIAGELLKANQILQVIIDTSPKEKEKIRNAAINLRADINSGKYDIPSFIKWLWLMISGNLT